MWDYIWQYIIVSYNYIKCSINDSNRKKFMCVPIFSHILGNIVVPSRCQLNFVHNLLFHVWQYLDFITDAAKESCVNDF